MTTTNTQPAPGTRQPPTIGVFDSGFGGLTVLRALLPLIPEARYIYLGDTARLPYGSKSHDTIARYAVESARFLHEQGAELLVVACNTATALAFEDIRAALPIPVIGVVEPGAQAAHNASTQDQTSQDAGGKNNGAIPDETLRNNGVIPSGAGKNKSVIPSEAKSRNPRILLGETHVPNTPATLEPPQVLVLATAATVQSRAYTRALKVLGIEAHEKACPLLVPLVEEGWTNHPVTDEVLRIYLTEALSEAPNTQTLLLGCTHYPLLEPAIHRTLQSLNHPLTIIDSAKATADAVATHLNLKQTSSPTAPTCRFYATDSIEKFERLGSAFLGQPVTGVHHVDLGG
jgi:glutamate racemase